jgi:hypothetical protein
MRPWEADSSADFSRRLGKSALELGDTSSAPSCPDIWELSNGDVAFIGRDVTSAYADRLRDGVSIGHDEKLVVLPRNMLVHARKDMPRE